MQGGFIADALAMQHGLLSPRRFLMLQSVTRLGVPFFVKAEKYPYYLFWIIPEWAAKILITIHVVTFIFVRAKCT